LWARSWIHDAALLTACYSAVARRHDCCASITNNMCSEYFQSAGGSQLVAEIGLARMLRCAYSWNETKDFCDCNTDTDYLTAVTCSACDLTASSTRADCWNDDCFFCTSFVLWSHSSYSESGLGVASWPPKRDFGGTPLSTEWFTHLPTRVGLPSVHWPLYKKRLDTGLDRRKTESV